MQRAQSIAQRHMQYAIQKVGQSILQQKSVSHDGGDEADEMVERLWCECREIWQRQLIEQGYSRDVVTGWFQATDDMLDDTSAAAAADATRTDDNFNLLAETHPTTTHTATSTTTNSKSLDNSDVHNRPDAVNTEDTRHIISVPTVDDDNQPFTAWAKLRRLNRRLLLWGDATSTDDDTNISTTTTATTIPRIIIEQLDRYGHGNETYWIKDAYPAIQQYANEQIDIRLHYNVTSPHPSLTTTGATTTTTTDGATHNSSSSHPHSTHTEESMRLLLLVDRKRKSVNKKKLVWDESLQQYTSKAPAVKRIRKSPLDPPLMPPITILPDVPRYPYPDTTTTLDTLDWKRNMDRLYHDDYFQEYIHLPPPVAPISPAPPSTSLLIGALCDTGQYHLFRQVASSSSSSTTDQSVHHQRRQHRRAIRARLGNHVPIRMSDDIHGRTNRSDHQPNKPWSKLLRTMSLSPTARDTSSNTTTTAASIPITDGSTPNEPRVVVVLETPHYWFDFDTGYCILEYVMEGKRTVGAFSNIELSLCDE